MSLSSVFVLSFSVCVYFLSNKLLQKKQKNKKQKTKKQKMLFLTNPNKKSKSWKHLLRNKGYKEVRPHDFPYKALIVLKKKLTHEEDLLSLSVWYG